MPFVGLPLHMQGEAPCPRKITRRWREHRRATLPKVTLGVHMPEEKKPLALSDLIDVLRAPTWRPACWAMGPPCAVTGMTIDSRAVAAGNLFVCKGAGFRPAFLESAVAAGAAAYLCEGVGEGLSIPSELVAAAAVTPALVVSDVRRAMALVAPVIYRHPEDQLHVVGITGAEGKSTVAYMLRSILVAAGQPTPSILGSIETDDGKVRYESHNTTPEAPDLWRHLRNTVDAGAPHHGDGGLEPGPQVRSRAGPAV